MANGSRLGRPPIGPDLGAFRARPPGPTRRAVVRPVGRPGYPRIFGALPGSPWVTWPGSDQGRSGAPTARCPSRPAPSCLHPVPSRSRAPDDRSPLRGVNPCWDGEPSSGPTLDREPPDRVRDGSTAGAACRGQTRRGPPVSSVGGVTRRSAGTLLPTENPDEPFLVYRASRFRRAKQDFRTPL